MATTLSHAVQWSNNKHSHLEGEWLLSLRYPGLLQVDQPPSYLNDWCKDEAAERFVSPVTQKDEVRTVFIYHAPPLPREA